MADINDKFSKVINGITRPMPTTLASQKIVGASSCQVLATTGWDTDTAVHGIMYRKDSQNKKIPGSQIDWKGVVTGTTINNFTVTAGNDDTYETGTTVELAPTAAWGDDMATGITQEHKQSGAHADVTADSVTTDALTVDGTSSTDFPSKFANFVSGGLVWTQTTGRVGTMTSGYIYWNGTRKSIPAIATYTFTASRDTYVDIDPTTGSPTYVPVTNGNTEPTVTSGTVRIAKVVTDGSSLTTVVSMSRKPVTPDIIDWATFIGFRATQSATLNTTGPGYTAINFNNEIYNVGNNFASRMFTAPVDGLYEFTFSANAGVQTITRMFYRFDGTVPQNRMHGERGSDLSPATGAQTYVVTDTISVAMKAGETFGLSLYTSQSINAASTGTQFSGRLVVPLPAGLIT